MATRYAAFGAVLEHDTNPPTSVFTAVAGLTNIEGPGGDTEEIDMTAHDSAGGFRELLGSFKDAGEINMTGWFDPNDVTHAEATGVTGFWKDRIVRDWQIRTPTGAALALDDPISFSGWIKSFRITLPFDGGYGFEATLRVTGEPVFP